MAEIECCNICGHQFAREWQVLLEDDDGHQEHGWATVEDYIVATLPSGEVFVCLDCYPQKVQERYGGAELAEIHYQRGLDLSYRHRKAEARDCFERALAVVRTADCLAALAMTFDTREEQDRLCREALALDPKCLVAQLNLERPAG